MQLDPLALDALKNNQRQLDADGCEVGVSRQALDELIAAYEALSRTGAVKVKAEIDRLRPHYQSMSAMDQARRQLLEHFERFLSALEPAAPEEQREAGAKLAKAVWGVDLVPATRPSEQAVTEALNRIRDYADKPHADRYVIRRMAEDALKAAMEAGRHALATSKGGGR